MSCLNNLRKPELKNLAQELGLEISPDARIVEIKTLIENSDIYKTDTDFVKGLINLIAEDRKSEIAREQVNLELERARASRIEKEIELERLKSQSGNENPEHAVLADSEQCPRNLENLIKSVKTLTVAVPEKPEAFHLFFQSLERAFCTKNVPDQWKSEVLINILGDKGNNVLAYASEQEIANYDLLKALILKEFQLTPRECLNNFRNAQRYPNESHIQFASRLSANFDYYCRLKEVKDFKSLCELIVADKLYDTLDFKTREHVGIREGLNWFKPNELGKEVDIFFSSRGKSLKENANSNRTENTHFDRPRVNKNFTERQKWVPKEPVRGYANSNRKTERTCYLCGSRGDNFHFARDCPKRTNKNEKPSSNAVSGLTNTSSDTTKSQLNYVDLFIDGKKVKCLKDTGSELIIVNKALFPEKPTLGPLKIKSCFGNVVNARKANFNFSFHSGNGGMNLIAAIAPELIVDAIFPPQILDLLRDSLVTHEKETVLSCDTPVPENYLSFISAGVCGTEIDLSHIKNEELRNTVSDTIKSYSPSKTPRTNEVRMNVILKDEIPVAQRSRRIPLVEQKIVDAQIDEWLRDGIVKESCSDFAAPVVLSKKKNGTTRLCVDFRQLNKKVNRNTKELASMKRSLKAVHQKVNALAEVMNQMKWQQKSCDTTTLPESHKINEILVQLNLCKHEIEHLNSKLLSSNQDTTKLDWDTLECSMNSNFKYIGSNLNITSRCITNPRLHSLEMNDNTKELFKICSESLLSPFPGSVKRKFPSSTITSISEWPEQKKKCTIEELSSESGIKEDQSSSSS